MIDGNFDGMIDGTFFTLLFWEGMKHDADILWSEWAFSETTNQKQAES